MEGTPRLHALGHRANHLLTSPRWRPPLRGRENPDVNNLVKLTTPANAVALSRSLNQPTLDLNGDTVYGIPVILRIRGSGGDRLIALDASPLCSDGGLSIDISREAMLRMDTTPDNPATASTVMVSLFQMNLAGLKAIRWINWKRVATSAVKYVSRAAYA